jgi:FeS assembly SUF system regulator
MIRITKLTDYGIVLLSHLALQPEATSQNVAELAEATHVPMPTVGKILKLLAKGKLLVSQRGVKGGYSLSRRPEEITVAQIIAALDGPIAITDCSGDVAGKCELERLCPVRSNWQRINVAVKDALEGITLAEMSHPLRAGFVPMAQVNAIHAKTEVLEPCP